MTTLTQRFEENGTLVSQSERLPAECHLQYTFTDGREGSIKEADSIWGSVRPKHPLSETIAAQKGLLFEVHDRRCTFQFSFLDVHGVIVFEKWVD